MSVVIIVPIIKLMNIDSGRTKSSINTFAATDIIKQIDNNKKSAEKVGICIFGIIYDIIENDCKDKIKTR